MNRLKYILYAMLFLGLSGCGDSFLDVNPSKKQKVPNTLEDYQAILDHQNMQGGSSHYLGIIGADEFYVTSAQWKTFPSGANNYQKNAYVWARELYDNTVVTDWVVGYTRILWTNIVLEGLPSLAVSADEQVAFNNAKGMALFFRARRYYELAQLFISPYNLNTSKDDLGLPLRLGADVTAGVPRSTVEETYRQILKDLLEALELLPENPLVIERPGKAAVYALLAKSYLQMGDYERVENYANLYLKLKSELLDFNDIDLNSAYPFPINGRGNPEVICMNRALVPAITGPSYFNADSNLLASYSAHDLRKQAYFFTNAAGRILYKGSYIGSNIYFVGAATDELYLIRAECYARRGQIQDAMDDLNYLCKRRYNRSTFIPFAVTGTDEALSLIFSERRKELVLRGTRWEDLRRLNKEAKFAVILKRKIDDQLFELQPNDNRYVWPFPQQAIDYGHYQQNER